MGASQAESTAAVERIYREHGSRLWWALLAWTGDRDAATEAVAESFAQALGRGDALRDPLAWIWKAAFRIAAGEMKRRRATHQLLDAPYEMEEPTGVLEALRRLSPKQRAAVVLFHYCGYRLSEIAEILGSNRATVSVHLSRGRRRLRAILQEEEQ